jgi:hypothetical protein
MTPAVVRLPSLEFKLQYSKKKKKILFCCNPSTLGYKSQKKKKREKKKYNFVIFRYVQLRFIRNNKIIYAMLRFMGILIYLSFIGNNNKFFKIIMKASILSISWRSCLAPGVSLV